MKSLLYNFVLNNLRDIVTLLAVTFLIVYLPKLIPLWFIVAILSIFIIKPDRRFYFISMGKSNHVKNWAGSGDFGYISNESAFQITKSSFGYIFMPTIMWFNYCVNVDFKILNGCLGLLIRARNTSDMILLQIGTEHIRPHLYVDSGYIAYNPDKTGLFINPSLSLDQWYKLFVCCENRYIKILLRNTSNKVVFDKSWEIPPTDTALVFEFIGEGSSKVKIAHSTAFEYGTVGFRNHGDERALVKNVLIRNTN